MLAAGELDAALVSSVEFLRNPTYRIVDGISISSDGPVYSVVLAYSGDAIPTHIDLDPASETSVALLRYLMLSRGEEMAGDRMGGDVLAPFPDASGRLLIGDQAIRFRNRFGSRFRYWDLGEEWKSLTGLPFVYALWLVRAEVTGAAGLAQRLRHLRDGNLADLEVIISGQAEFAPEFCHRYYTEYLRFSLDDRDKDGLRRFAAACAGMGLIASPNISFDLI